MIHRPAIIQGGMGVAVSGWQLARAVARTGQLGVVSGTALDLVLARRLQLGDPGGDIRRAMAAFPDPAVAERILAGYFVEGGIAEGAAFKAIPVFTAEPRRRSFDLAVMGGFVEVWLAKEGHDGIVGINFLEKIQLPTPPTLYGAMLAGVDVVLVGAGIPRDIPRLLDGLATHEPIELPLHVIAGDGVALTFDPRGVLPEPGAPLRRPMFLAIIASTALAISLARKTPGVDGFVIEGPTAGGHNAPPRGAGELVDGQPVYGPRDEVDLAKIRELELPFWLAGGQATPDRLRRAQEAGATGIQVGTVFAFCEDSGMAPELRARVLADVEAGRVTVFTDPLASPTGFPFKVVALGGTLSDEEVSQARERRCDLGYLREVYVAPDGRLGYRCPAEPIEDYVRKGGDLSNTEGRKCICNGLTATIGLGQRRQGVKEPPIVTAGNDLEELGRLLGPDRHSYTASEIVNYLLGAQTSGDGPTTPAAETAAAPVVST
jgi:NAD(P)H-dependent flavin oxidoreductase YrpB (nitropropane dioxygenase family)